MTSAALSTPTDPGQANAVAPASPTPAPATPATPATEQKGEASTPAPETPKQQTAADKLIEALKPTEKKEGDKPAAPEKYEAWKLPEGVKLSEEVDAEFTAMAREAGYDQEKAQARLEKLVAAHEKSVQADIKSQVEQWGEELMRDPKLGGDRLESYTKPMILRALHAYDKTGELAGLLEKGLIAHPAMARVLVAIGESVSPHAELVTGHRSAPPASSEEEFYEATK